jgi:hypothetical protein
LRPPPQPPRGSSTPWRRRPLVLFQKFKSGRLVWPYFANIPASTRK